MSPELREHIESLDVRVLILNSGKRIVGIVNEIDEFACEMFYPLILVSEHTADKLVYYITDQYVPLSNHEPVSIYHTSVEAETHAGFNLKASYHSYLIKNKVDTAMEFEDEDDDEDNYELNFDADDEMPDEPPTTPDLDPTDQSSIDFWEKMSKNWGKEDLDS